MISLLLICFIAGGKYTSVIWRTDHVRKGRRQNGPTQLQNNASSTSKYIYGSKLLYLNLESNINFLTFKADYVMILKDWLILAILRALLFPIPDMDSSVINCNSQWRLGIFFWITWKYEIYRMVFDFSEISFFFPPQKRYSVTTPGGRHITQKTFMKLLIDFFLRGKMFYTHFLALFNSKHYGEVRNKRTFFSLLTHHVGTTGQGV